MKKRDVPPVTDAPPIVKKRIEMWELPWKHNIDDTPAPMNETVICRCGGLVDNNPTYRIHKGQELLLGIEYITLQEFYNLAK